MLKPDLKTKIKVLDIIQDKKYVTAKDLHNPSTYKLKKNNNFEAGCYGAWCNCYQNYTFEEEEN